jgi:outer membrane cobalamin receptor
LLKKNRYLLIVFSIVGLILCSSVIWADDSDNNVSEEEVVVTASRTAEPESQAPGKTEVITKEEIEQSGATTVAEALEDTGVNISSYGGKAGAATVQLDGADAKQTLVLVNGVPANTGTDGSVDLSYFPVSAIERIEVSHGPLSALYGSSAVGGVVNIITDLTGRPLNEINVSYGSFDTKSLDFKYQQPNWGVALGGNMTDGFTDYTETYSNYLMGQYNFFQTQDEYLKLYWQDLSKHGQKRSTTEEADQNLAVNLNGLSKMWAGEWEYKIYGQHYDLHYDPDRHQLSSYGIDAAGRYQLENHELLTGGTVKQENCESTAYSNHFRNDGGLFVQDNWQLSDRWKLIAGLRQDYYTDFTSPLLPKITLVNSLSDQISIKAGYGKVFRAPSFQDLYWPTTSSVYDGTTYIYSGNSNLKPEEGDRYDFITEWKRDQQLISLDIYQSNLQNEIDWVSTSSAPNIISYTSTNFGKVFVNGVSLNWQNTWANIVTGKIGYNYLDKKTDDQEYNYFGKNQFNVGLDFKYKAWQYGMNWQFIRDREYVSSGYAIKLPNYDVLNLNIKYLASKNLSFTLTIDNSTDEVYQVINKYLMPGRSYTLSTKYTF